MHGLENSSRRTTSFFRSCSLRSRAARATASLDELLERGDSWAIRSASGDDRCC